MISYTEHGIGVVEGPQFSGKSTQLAELSMLFKGELVVVPESCDWVGGNINFPRLSFETLEDAKKSIVFFLELERRRCDYAVDMRERTGLPVVMDRTSSFSSLMLYKLLQERFRDRFPFEGMLDIGIETFQLALEQGKIFLPDRMILMYPADEQTLQSRLSRGGSLGQLNTWENIKFIIDGYQRMANIKYPNANLQVPSINFDPRSKEISEQIVKFLRADVSTTEADLFDIFEIKRPLPAEDRPAIFPEIEKKVSDLIQRAKSEYRKISEGSHIRPVSTPEDAKAFRDVILYVLKHEWGFEYNPELSYDLDHPFEIYGRGEGKCFILETNGKVVGTVAVEDMGGGVAHWRRLMVLPEYRDKGWGYDLNRLLVDYCKAHGFTKAYFDTLKGTGMYRKYIEKWGAVIVGEEQEGENTRIFMEVEIANL